jgi:hypothetical protein
MPSTTYPFTNPANYTTNQADVTGGKGQLSLVDKPSQNFNQPFDNDTGFTYDSLRAEFASGLVRQKSVVLNPDLLYYNNFNDLNGVPEVGSGTFTPTGSSTVNTGKIVIFPGAFNDATASVNQIGLGDTFTFRSEYIPQYSGSPTDQINAVNIFESGVDQVQLLHKTSGQLAVMIQAGGVTLLASTDVGAYSPTSGSGDEIEISVDLPNNSVWVYLNGTRIYQNLSLPSGSFTWNPAANVFYGNSGGPSFTTGHWDNLSFFSSVQHTGASYTPAESTAGLSFHTNFNDGSTNAGIASGSSAIVTGPSTTSDSGFSGFGKTLDGNLNEILEWDALGGNANHQNQLTLRFMWNPSFATVPNAPGVNGVHCLLSLRDPASASNVFPHISYANGVELFVGGSSNSFAPGAFGCQIYDDSGTAIQQKNFGAFDRSLYGTWIEVELNLDFAAGSGRLFLDGVQFGTAWSWAPFSRASFPSQYRVTLNTALNNTTDVDSATYDALSIFDNIKHISNYTAGTVEYYLYEESKVDLPTFSYAGLGAIQSLDSLSLTSSGGEKYIIDGKYWDGAAWSVSDGSFAQANSLSEVNTNISSIVLDDSSMVPVSVVFPDGSTQESVDNLTLEHTGQQYATDGNIKVLSSVLASNIEGLTATLNEPTVSQKVRFVADVNGNDMYWDGSQWAASNCTIVQSNTLADMNTNLPTLLAGDVLNDVFMKVLFETGDQDATPDIDEMTITFNTTIVEIEECLVSANLENILVNVPTIDPANPPKLHVTATRTFTNGLKTVVKGTQSVDFDSNGMAQISVVTTESVGERLEFGISIPDGRATQWIMFEPAIVPEESSKALEQITEVKKYDFG